MSEQATAIQANQGAPAQATAPSQPVQQVMPAAAAQPDTDQSTAPDSASWLPGRLARERKSLLTKFGAESEEQLTEMLANAKCFEQANAKRLEQANAKRLEQAAMSETERLQAQVTELTPQVQAGSAYRVAFESMVKAQFDALTPEMQARIDAKANGDALRRSEFMEVLGASPAAVTAPVITAAPVAATPVTAGNGGPPPPRPVGNRSLFEQFEAISDSVARSVFYQVNARGIEASRPTS